MLRGAISSSHFSLFLPPLLHRPHTHARTHTHTAFYSVKKVQGNSRRFHLMPEFLEETAKHTHTRQRPRKLYDFGVHIKHNGFMVLYMCVCVCMLVCVREGRVTSVHGSTLGKQWRGTESLSGCSLSPGREINKPPLHPHTHQHKQIGRASCRERV